MAASRSLSTTVRPGKHADGGAAIVKTSYGWDWPVDAPGPLLPDALVPPDDLRFLLT